MVSQEAHPVAEHEEDGVPLACPVEHVEDDVRLTD
jgi:hypothetical protein